jgi:hypothetical protein
MTHEHLDHVQGLYRASRGQPSLELAVEHAWLTASAAPDYYERHRQAKQRRLALWEDYQRIHAYLAARAAAEPVPAALQALMANNDWNCTRSCVDYLRQFAGKGRTTYVHRGSDLTGAHPFREARLRIWAPEEDTSVYYGYFRPFHARLAASPEPGQPLRHAEPAPPEGVDPEAFARLLRQRREGLFDNLLAIDAAANNASVVFSLEWRGWRLLFPGDAEIRSWQLMAKADVIEPVHLLKVAHHGSRNGTPAGAILDRLLPREAPDGRPRQALISTHHGTYYGVPDPETAARLEERGVSVHRVDERALATGGFLDVELAAS